MKKCGKLEVNYEINKILKDFCFRKNKNIDEFVEDAILEKIEKEELEESMAEIINSDEYSGEILKEYILDELEIYKKKH